MMAISPLWDRRFLGFDATRTGSIPGFVIVNDFSTVKLGVPHLAFEIRYICALLDV
jgi:hypothetical protein